ncbi:MAG: hypothetical protein ACPLSO_07165 [Fervidicoccaceae archaeon]
MQISYVASEEEAREIRRKNADWNFIEAQKPRIREALKYCVEKGDLYIASRPAGLKVEEFNELRIRDGIPNAA